MYPLRIEPAVVDGFELSHLFKSCIDIVDGIDEFLVMADSVHGNSRNINITELNIVTNLLVDLQLHGYCSPDKILVMATVDACQSLAGGKQANLEVRMGMAVDIDIAVVVLLQDKGVLRSEVGNMVQARRTLAKGHLQTIVAKHTA